MTYHCQACGHRWHTWWAKGSAEAHATQARQGGFAYAGQAKSVFENARDIKEREGRSMDAVVKIHHGRRGSLAISTNAGTEEAFLVALRDTINQTTGGGDTVDDPNMGLHLYQELQTQIVNVCCKLRGYKADVTEHRVIVAGEWVPDDVVDVFGRERADPVTA